MSLLDKAREYSLSIDDLKRCCRPEHAEEIAKDFSEWRLASSRLKINPDEVSVIERNDSHDEAVQRKKFLEKWMKNNGDDATYLMLLEALVNNGRMDLVESLLKLIKGSSMCYVYNYYQYAQLKMNGLSGLWSQ